MLKNLIDALKKNKPEEGCCNVEMVIKKKDVSVASDQNKKQNGKNVNKCCG